MKNLISILFGVLIFCLPASSQPTIDFTVCIQGDLGDPLACSFIVKAEPTYGSCQGIPSGTSHPFPWCGLNGCSFITCSYPWIGTITPTCVGGTCTGYTFTPVNRVVRFISDTVIYFTAHKIVGVKETPTVTSSSLSIVYRNGIVIQGLTAGLPYEVTAFDLRGKVLYHLCSISARSTACIPWKSKESCIFQAKQNSKTSIRRF